MGKLQVGFLTTCVFLFISLKSQINCTSLKEKDLIKELPGQPPRVSFKQYGGYVAVNESSGRFFYYYFVEAIKPKNSSPLVIWLNGGPGCTSLKGAFIENGPFRVHSDGKTLYRNPYSWNNEANMLYVESPTLVGFSYTNTPSDLDNEGDKMTAEDNYVFLVKWLERFTEYKGRELYLTGQSYAGHYVSQLSQIILHRNNKTFINLKGVLLGNPGLDKLAERKGDDEYLVNHAIVTREMLDHKKEVCNFEIPQPKWDECRAAINAFIAIKSNYDEYNIYAPMCLNSTLTSKPEKETSVLKFSPCSPHYLTAYLNNANVQEAIHANTTKLPYAWRTCNDRIQSWKDEDIETSMIPILQEMMKAGIRVFVYSGDVDSAVSTTSTQKALKLLNLTIEKTWRPWFSEGEVGGYIEEYKENFTYATVRGGGHDVPRDQPIRALTLFINFIHNTPLPQL